jgi:hypothetical protein
MAGFGALESVLSMGRELFGLQIRANDRIADIAKRSGVTMDTLRDTPPETLSDILNRAARSGAIDPRHANSINIHIAQDAQEAYKDSFNIDAAHGQADANTSIGTTLVPRGDGTFREMMVEFEPGRTALDDENLGINRFVDVNEKDETLDPNNLGTWFGSYNSRGEPDIANFFAEREKSNNLSAGAVYPVKLRIEKPKIFDRYEDFEDEMREWSEMAEENGIDVTSQAFVKDLQDQGHDGIMIERSDTDTGEVRSDYVPFNANQIRSIFAKFDPSKKDSGNISASIAGGAVGLGALQNAGDPE